METYHSKKIYLPLKDETNKIGLDTILWPLDQLACLQGQILSNKCGPKWQIHLFGNIPLEKVFK